MRLFLGGREACQILPGVISEMFLQVTETGASANCRSLIWDQKSLARMLKGSLMQDPKQEEKKGSSTCKRGCKGW